MSGKLPDSPLKQELGSKKYQEKVDAANKFYDTYKAGKRDPKTGVYYNQISFTDPRKSKVGSGTSLGCFQCPTENCSGSIIVKRTTVYSTCLSCKKLISVSVDKSTDEVLLKVEA